MGKIIVTGASGQFGNAAAKLLLETVPAEDLIVLSRTTDKLAEFAEAGASVHAADFDDPASLLAAMAGGERMLLISTTRVGTRVQQHTNAVEAAKANGVKHVVYTSILGCGKPGNPSVEQFDHLATERMIEQSGLAWTHLRDSLYAEAVATAMAIPALQAGHKPENAGMGLCPIVSRDDCVAIAVGVLTQEGHENKAYDVTGPELWALPDAMALVAQMAGKPIEIEPVDDEGMYRYFDSLGVARKASDVVPDGPIPWASEGMVTFGQSIREGFMDVVSNDVERITGRPPRTLRSVLEQYQGLWPA
ncbi:MAG: SDR family oxidoreductase [Candidatus Andeanibacterium colombiense]|uniref:SDR family oxidoreductase n=1 Tax=Candidatus Andeanibacterium colombiense TaxID=3121345 RepID=A0AAJ5X3T5_9SPHN|nr:MAG: SDR family oxidoreductase [Sphingomonadaceae bacterium]